MSHRFHHASISHHDATIAELRASRGFMVEYLKLALEELDDPDNRAVGLLALRDIAEASGGLATIAREAGISRESLYRALSPSGNPTLKTLLAVLHAVGMRLSVVPAADADANADANANANADADADADANGTVGANVRSAVAVS